MILVYVGRIGRYMEKVSYNTVDSRYQEVYLYVDISDLQN